MKRIILMAVLAASFGVGARADDVDLPHVAVFGTAVTNVMPDQMAWSVTVSNRGAALADVAGKHAETVRRVLDFLKDNKAPEKDIQTSRMEFGENWEYKGQSRVREGYFASTRIAFKTNDLDKYAAVWMGLAEYPEVSLDEVRYDHSKRIDYQNQTREEAVLAAKQKAETLAQSLGARIGEPLLIEEDLSASEGSSQPNFNRVTNVAAQSGEDRPTIAPGRIPVRTRVRVAFRLVAND